MLLNDGNGNFSFVSEGWMSYFAFEYGVSFDSTFHEAGQSYAVAVYDNGHADGLPSFFFAQERRNYQIYPNQGSRQYTSTERNYFERDLSSEASSGSMKSGHSVAFDHDNDGDMDLLVLNRGEKNQLLINDGTGSFTFFDEEAWESQLPGFMKLTIGPLTQSRKAVVFDADGDGDDDIFIVNYGSENRLFYQRPSHEVDWNGEDNPFEGVVFWPETDHPGDLSERSDYSVNAVALDANGDGHLDLYVLNVVYGNELLINDGGSHPNANFTSTSPKFNRVSSAGDLPISFSGAPGYHFVATVGDYDGDGSTE